MNNPPLNLDDMIRTEDYMTYESETTMSLQYRIINLPPLVVNRVTHQNIIDTWYDYLDSMLSPYITDEIYDSIQLEIQVIENYHEDQDTINDIVHDFSEVN